METQFTIANGPGKFELQIALFRGKKGYDDVDFKVDNPNGDNPFLIQCSIQSVRMEDGSHESWNLTGYAMLPEKEDPGRPRRKFKAYFHTIKRQGHLELIDD